MPYKDPERRKEAMKRFRANNPGYDKQFNQRKKLRVYKMTLSEFNHLYDSQDGQCAICQMPLTPGQGTHIDHDHETGKIRGLLCIYCNRALGMFRDDMNILSAAIAYIQNYQEKK